MQKYFKPGQNHTGTHEEDTQRDRKNVYRLGGQLVEIASSLIAPHHDSVNADELSADPSLTTTTRLRTQQREVTSIINLNRTQQTKHTKILSIKTVGLSTIYSYT